MSKLMATPPYSPVQAVREVIHGVTIEDPYRWLEDQNCSQTRIWLESQNNYARTYLDSIPNRPVIRQRICELVDIETYDSIKKVGPKYFFRKRLPGQEQPCIYMRAGLNGEDRVLIDPCQRGTGEHTAVRPLHLSPDGRLLLYEVKEGGERTGTFELLDVDRQTTLSDALPRGYLPGFAFARDSKSFYYIHQATCQARPNHSRVYHHVLGEPFADDKQIFAPHDDGHIRLHLVAGKQQLGFLVRHLLDKIYTDFFVWPFGDESPPELVVAKAEYKFAPLLLSDNRILGLTDRDAPNSRVVELIIREDAEPEFQDVIPETSDSIQNVAVTESRILVSYVRSLQTQITAFDLVGKPTGQLPVSSSATIRVVGASFEEEEAILEVESFTQPIQIYRYSSKTGDTHLWAARTVPFDDQAFGSVRVWFTSRDGTRVPMSLVGRHDVLENGPHPTIMTSYGGYGIPMTPQFSVFVAFLLERGCLFALPNIRGGSEFGVEWHTAAKRRNRQVAFDDFLSAAEWMIASGRTSPQKLAIFGGSNSGLLVGAAMTQRPELFRAVVCMVPLLDMLRYHLFDNASDWKEEFGSADNLHDFQALLNYSPYAQVREGTHYPATMIVSGDADQNCNPLHARKMIARLQAANASKHPIILDYNDHRGHAPVLPLHERIEALTDRMAFLCDQLQLPI